MNDIVFHEKAIVGLALLDPAVIDRNELSLCGYGWTDAVCRDLWDLLCDLRRAGQPIGDIRIVADAAKKRGIAIRDIGVLASHEAGVPLQESYYVGALVKAMDRARLRAAAEQVLRDTEDFNIDPNDIRNRFDVAMRSIPPRQLMSKSIGELAAEVVQRSRDPKHHVPSVLTGLYSIDEITGGFRPGEMIVLAARPSIGKSALAAQWAINAAAAGHRTLFVSLEMEGTDVACRAVALAGRVPLPLKDLRDGQLRNADLEVAASAARTYSDLPLQISDVRGMNIDRLKMLIRTETSRCKLGLVVIDYLGLLLNDRRKSPYEFVTEISYSIKDIARSESLPVLALCQLNRAAEGGRPSLANLRDSGAIEQDADMVIFLHREDRFSSDAEIIVAKQRNGPVGRINVEYNKARFRFDEGTVFQRDPYDDDTPKRQGSMAWSG